ncbi:hypothetical protein ACFYRN_23230 [Streptomyces sp. NPDC005227]|uniref:hypothetical protein n=1 Tax=Streptomyces sp. NPDC005227 TaxID=3364707 RepID=UPI003691F037
MTRHQATPEELDRLEAAQTRTYQTAADLAQAEADLAGAHVADNDARTELNRAIHDVLHGSQKTSEEHGKTLYDLSNQAAQDHWPSPRPTPGG